MSVYQTNVSLNPEEAYNMLSFFVERNKELQKIGNAPNAICFQGEAGISKTAVVQQVAKDKNIVCEKVNLANLDDLGD